MVDNTDGVVIHSSVTSYLPIWGNSYMEGYWQTPIFEIHKKQNCNVFLNPCYKIYSMSFWEAEEITRSPMQIFLRLIQPQLLNNKRLIITILNTMNILV